MIVDKTSYDIKLLDGMIDINTLSKCENYYYRIKKPKEIWGNYFCKVSFYDQQGMKIYYRSELYCHALPPYDMTSLKFNFVNWSPSGNNVLVYEFLSSKIYELKVLFLNEKKAFGLDVNKKGDDFMKGFESDFTRIEYDENSLIKKGFLESHFYNDKLPLWGNWMPKGVK